MFSNLRQGALVYVLHKDEPRLEVGEVISVGQPIPEFGTTYSAGFPIAGQKMVVELKIKVGNDDITLQRIPADMQVADFGTGMVVSENREAILLELNNLRKTSQSIVDSVDRHNSIISKCDELMQELNPQAKQDAEREKEIKSMRDEMNGLRGDMTDIKALLSKIVNKNKKED